MSDTKSTTKSEKKKVSAAGPVAKAKAKTKAKAKKRIPNKTATPLPPTNQHYNVGAWHGLPHYQCAHCPWSTLNEAEIINHVASHHVEHITVHRVDTGLITESGAKIVREEVVVEPEQEQGGNDYGTDETHSI